MTDDTFYGSDFGALSAFDPEIAGVLTSELDRIRGGLQLIASENISSPEVLTALAGEIGPGTDTDPVVAAHAALRGERPIILVGERLATVPGARWWMAGMALNRCVPVTVTPSSLACLTAMSVSIVSPDCEIDTTSVRSETIGSQ